MQNGSFVFNLLLVMMFAVVFPLIGEEEGDRPIIIAHRGASVIAPENTAASIREACRVGARVIEFDVRTTVDGKLRLFHDKNLERICSDKRTFEQLADAEAETLDVGSWFTGGDFSGERPILLKEAIELCWEGGATALIEHKTGTAAQYAEVLRDIDAIGEVIVQSFDWKFLRDMKKEIPELQLGALGSKELDAKRRTELDKLAPAWVGWNHEDFRLKDLGWLHERKMKLALWTVNDLEKAKKLGEAGVNGIITDHPAEALAIQW